LRRERRSTAGEGGRRERRVVGVSPAAAAAGRMSSVRVRSGRLMEERAVAMWDWRSGDGGE
jgi:hypothetical protein